LVQVLKIIDLRRFPSKITSGKRQIWGLRRGEGLKGN